MYEFLTPSLRHPSGIVELIYPGRDTFTKPRRGISLPNDKKQAQKKP